MSDLAEADRLRQPGLVDMGWLHTGWRFGPDILEPVVERRCWLGNFGAENMVVGPCFEGVDS